MEILNRIVIMIVWDMRQLFRKHTRARERYAAQRDR